MVSRGGEPAHPRRDHRSHRRVAVVRVFGDAWQGTRARPDRARSGSPRERCGLMATLARRVGLGLNARGDVAEFVRWADRARSLGLESVWIHDSYFERDAVTYASAVAAQVQDIKIGLGALNPFTRHPVLIAMTISA